jgi:hypothetical protein
MFLFRCVSVSMVLSGRHIAVETDYNSNAIARECQRHYVHEQNSSRPQTQLHTHSGRREPHMLNRGC